MVGIGVDFQSYHDQWLSEGFADFSGLWYMQTVRKDNDKYFDMLRRWKGEILARRGEPGPISLGYRVYAFKDYDNDYQTIVYRKGAWVGHMLRILMLDLKTMNEDRFTETMRDFYRKFEGQRATTEDFRKVVEQHAGTDMGWFFNQWVYAAATPTYRVAYHTDRSADGQFKVKLRVLQDNVSEDFQAFVPVTLDLGKDRKARLRVKVRGPRTEIDLPPMPAEPKNLRFNDLEGVLADVKMVDWRD
ncbi:MAG TPA: M1 family aminopeptidase [Gemmatimonadales bacterium]